MHQWILCAALAATAGGALATPVPAGTQLNGTASGTASALLGLDSGFADVPGSGITALTDSDLEYLSNDFAVGIDFFSDGRVVFYDNTGLGQLAGSYTFSFELLDLPGLVVGFDLADLAGITGGSISTQLIDGHRFSITLSDVGFADAFGSFSAQLNTVPEPSGTALLALAGLALTWTSRRTRRQGA